MPGMADGDSAKSVLPIRLDIPIYLYAGYNNILNEAQIICCKIQIFTLNCLSKRRFDSVARQGGD